LIQTEADFKRKLEKQLQFETLLFEISAGFVNLPTDQIDSKIEDALRRICERLGLDLSSLWHWSDSRPYFLMVTHLHSPPEGPLRPEGIDAQEAFPLLWCGPLIDLISGYVMFDWMSVQEMTCLL